ncbi:MULTISPECIES: hypothetical protein [Pseudomonas]|uniref:hypothetical protein n=1 Tax=Pseudomonas TaxID=286 RepID=UPI0039869923
MIWNKVCRQQKNKKRAVVLTAIRRCWITSIAHARLTGKWSEKPWPGSLNDEDFNYSADKHSIGWSAKPMAIRLLSSCTLAGCSHQPAVPYRGVVAPMAISAK